MIIVTYTVMSQKEDEIDMISNGKSIERGLGVTKDCHLWSDFPKVMNEVRDVIEPCKGDWSDYLYYLHRYYLGYPSKPWYWLWQNLVDE
jgi:hypothetical protein